jgi:hypothetical protein
MVLLGKESSFSTATSSLHVVSANARQKISSGLMLSCTVSPTSLFHDDSTMRKCVKADLTHELEREVCPSFTLPSFDKTLTVLIRDGMAQQHHLCMSSVLMHDKR